MTVHDRDITAQEAAALFGITVHMVYRWERDRRLTAAGKLKSPGRKGSTSLFRLSEVAALVADRHADTRPTTR